MNRVEIKDAITRLRYEGGWSLRKLGDHIGLAPGTIKRAIIGLPITAEAQTRLVNALPLVPAKAPKPKTREQGKNKPGHRRRQFRRYYNLMRMKKILEEEPGLSKTFPWRFEHVQTKERAAYLCAAIDHDLKVYLLDLFGEEIERKSLMLADCYQVEKWIERIHATFPRLRPALFNVLKGE